MVQSSFAVYWLLILGFMIIFSVGLVMAVAIAMTYSLHDQKKRRHAEVPSSESHPGVSLGFKFLWVLGFWGALLGFALLGLIGFRATNMPAPPTVVQVYPQPIPPREAVVQPLPAPPVTSEEKPRDPTPVPDSTEKENRADPGPSSSTLPEWVREFWPNPAVVGSENVARLSQHPEQAVFRSGQFATLSDAEADIRNAALPMIRERVNQHFASSNSWFTTFSPPEEAVLSATVTDRHIEMRQHDFGRFTAPMYRVFWKVDTNAAGLLLLRVHQQAAVERERLILFAGGWIVVTGLLAGIGRWLRPPVPKSA